MYKFDTKRDYSKMIKCKANKITIKKKQIIKPAYKNIEYEQLFNKLIKLGFINYEKYKDYKKICYYMKVWYYTMKNDLHMLENFNMRGYKSFHIDHILRYGLKFEHEISYVSNVRGDYKRYINFIHFVGKSG